MVFSRQKKKKTEKKKKSSNWVPPPKLEEPRKPPSNFDDNALGPPSMAFEMLGEAATPSQSPVSFQSMASQSTLLSELKDRQFTQGLKKVDPAQIRKPPKRSTMQETDYRSLLRKVTHTELETHEPTQQMQYLQTSEGYELAAEELEKKNLIPNAATAYACAALCVYLALDVKMAVNFLSSYAKGVPLIAKESIFQTVREIFRGILLKDSQILAAVANQLPKSQFFSKEDVDVFEAAIQKAVAEL